MARTGVRYEQVAAAAEALTEAGEVPTIDKVRASLGTGSKTTITRHLKAWRQTQPQQGIEPVLTGKEQAELPAATVASLEQVWAELQSRANESIAALEAQHAAERGRMAQRLRAERQRRRQATQAASVAQGQVEALQQQLAKQGRRLEQVQQARTHAEQRLREVNADNQVLQTQLARSSESFTQLEQTRQQERDREREQWQQTLEAERRTFAATEAKWQQALTQQHEAASARETTLNQTFEQARTALQTQLDTQIAAQQHQQADCHAQLTAKDEQIERLRGRVSRLRQAVTGYRRQAQMLQDQVADKASLEALHSAMEQMRQAMALRVGQLREEIKALQAAGNDAGGASS